jgi:Domain of unknown function (DUF4375)
MPNPGERYWSLIEPYWRPLNRTWDEGPDEFLAKFAAVPPVVGNLYAAHWCQSEVCNGGLLQFFSNSTGLLAPEALNAFRVIGIDQWANILMKAMEFFGTPYPRDRAARRALLPRSDGRKRADWDPFCALDKQFYEWLHAERHRWLRVADAYAERGTAE